MNAGQRIEISQATARFCGAYGLLKEDENYSDEELRRMGLIHTLLDAGFPDSTLKRYLDLLEFGQQGKNERVRLLRRHRSALLEKIHTEQKTLDHLDYLIREQETLC